MCVFVQGGDGGRIINIASLAGILTGLGPIEQSGYTMAKWGTAALTRSMANCKPNLEKKEGIKGCALCPWFADTQLVREMMNVKKLQKATKQRVSAHGVIIF